MGAFAYGNDILMGRSVSGRLVSTWRSTSTGFGPLIWGKGAGASDRSVLYLNGLSISCLPDFDWFLPRRAQLSSCSLDTHAAFQVHSTMRELIKHDHVVESLRQVVNVCAALIHQSRVQIYHKTCLRGWVE